MENLGISKSETTINVKLSLKELGTIVTALGNMSYANLREYNCYNRTIIEDCTRYNGFFDELNEIYNEASK